MSRWPVWASAPERASDTTGCSRLARGPRLPARPGLQVPLDRGQSGRAGSWCLGPRNVCTRPGMGWSVFQSVAVPLVAQKSEMAAQKSEMAAQKSEMVAQKGEMVAQKSEMAVSPDRLADGHKSFIPKRLGCVPCKYSVNPS